MNNQSEVIILKNSDYRDADAIVNVLSRDYGKMSFVARGIRKAKSKNANSCSLFNLSRFHFNLQEQRTMQSLKTAENIQNFRKIREDLLKQSIASIMVEIMDKINVDEFENSFSLLKTSLTYLNTTENDICLFGLYLAQICHMCGITPYVDSCAKCGNTDSIATISLLDGGFLCNNCMDIHQSKKDRSTLKFFRLFNKASIEQFPVLEAITPCTYADIEDLLALFMEYSGVQIKGLSFLKQVLAFDE